MGLLWVLLCQGILLAYANEDFMISTHLAEENQTVHNENHGVLQKCGIRNGYYLNRIVSGHTAEPGEFPWIVSIQMKLGKFYRHICGGAIIHSTWILSAGHCVFDFDTSEIYVVAGDHNIYVRDGFEQRRRVIKVETTNFDIANFENDIGLLKVDVPFKFNIRVSPICIPRPNDVFTGPATVGGWGRTAETEHNSQILRHVTVPIMKKAVCDDHYKRIGFSGFLNECQMCAGYIRGGKDACQGDSGGPLMCRVDEQYFICGVVSWGIGCARASFPGIYTKVTCFANWVQRVIEKK